MSIHRTQGIPGLAQLFQALANPQRLRIVLRLAACGEAACCCRVTPEGMRQCVGDLGAGLGLAPSTVSHHIKELRRAGLLKMERRGQRIECWIDPEAVHLLMEFLTGLGGNRPIHDTGAEAWTCARSGEASRVAAAGATQVGSPATGVVAEPAPRADEAGSGV